MLCWQASKQGCTYHAGAVSAFFYKTEAPCTTIYNITLKNTGSQNCGTWSEIAPSSHFFTGLHVGWETKIINIVWYLQIELFCLNNYENIYFLLPTDIRQSLLLSEVGSSRVESEMDVKMNNNKALISAGVHG